MTTQPTEPGTEDESDSRDLCIGEVPSHHKVQPFGPSLLPEKHSRGALDGLDLPDDRLETRKRIRTQAPSTPGIYGYFDSHGRLNYVGKSKCLRNRLLSYFSRNPPDDKMSRIVQHSRFLRWEPVSHELLALIREQELISRWRPSFNTQGQPQRRQPAFLCLSDRDAPHVIVTTRIRQKTRNGFGPIPGTGRLRTTAEQLNQVFRLRDCNDQVPMRFTDQLELFPIAHPPGCIRYEIGSCSGPCTGTFARADYSRQVQELLGFLNGFDNSPLLRIEQEMKTAAGRCAFEKASMLRDQLQNIRWLGNRLGALRRARYELNCIYPVEGFAGKRIWICLNSSLISGMVVEPSGKRQTQKALREIQVANSVHPNNLPHDTTTVLMQLIVTSWFRKYPEEHKQLLPFPEALAICERVHSSRNRKT